MCGMKVYFMSICGTGMGNGALLMRALGHEVLGADSNTYPPMSDRLAAAGVTVLNGYDAGRLAQLGVDMVVVGNVNTRGNPEVEWLLAERRVAYVSLPELLARELLSKRRSIVVSGTHGKTTTTNLTAALLRANGVDAGYLVGGVPFDLPGGAAVGDAAAPFVIEGDEYDSAFFDKRSKFVHYCPHTLILNNLEYDHADIYRDLEDVSRSFSHVVKLVPSNGYILANSDDSAVEALVGVDWAPVLRVGTGERADLRIEAYSEDASGSRFRLRWRGQEWGWVEWAMWGEYNARNAAMAALAAGLHYDRAEPTRLSLAAFGGFRGVKRRQEILHAGEGIVIMTDFAHHPTAVLGTLRALRARYPEHALWAVHEARSNTACRKVHEAAYALSFDSADRVYFGPVYRADRYNDGERIDLEGVARRLGGRAAAYNSNAEVLAALRGALGAASGKKTVVVFFSNGSFDGIPQQLVAAAVEDEKN